jgi:type I restriction enzyme M protein
VRVYSKKTWLVKGRFVRRSRGGFGPLDTKKWGNNCKAKADISIYGQESNYTTWRLAKMNLAIRGIEGQIAHGDTFHNDRFPDLKADFILANPPFNVSDWGGERLREDQRWKYGVPPVGNANFALVQQMIYCLVSTECGVILCVSGA